MWQPRPRPRPSRCRRCRTVARPPRVPLSPNSRHLSGDSSVQAHYAGDGRWRRPTGSHPGKPAAAAPSRCCRPCSRPHRTPSSSCGVPRLGGSTDPRLGRERRPVRDRTDDPRPSPPAATSRRGRVAARPKLREGHSYPGIRWRVRTCSYQSGRPTALSPFLRMPKSPETDDVRSFGQPLLSAGQMYRAQLAGRCQIRLRPSWDRDPKRGATGVMPGFPADRIG